MRRPVAHSIFMSCFMMILVALPQLAGALWKNKSLLLALVSLTFPMWVWVMHLLAVRLQKNQASSTATLVPENSVDSLPRWLQAIVPYSIWFMSVFALWIGYDHIIDLATPFWFRLIFLIFAVGCGVLGFFLGWRDVQKHRKEQRALQSSPQQAITENILQAHNPIIENPENEPVPLRRG